MIVNYPLKHTFENSLNQTFETYISQFYGLQAWGPVKDSFQKMEKLRNSFEFQKYNVSMSSDPSTLDKLEKSILEYYNYCIIVDSKFRFETYQSGCVGITFKWTDSFDAQKAIGTTQIKYEMCSLLYNLAIVYYFYGCNLMSRNQVDDRKEAIKKFRYGIWALTEFKNMISSVAPEVKNTQMDFSLENISILENVMFGLVYACLYDNLQPQQKQLGGIKNVIQLAGEAAKFFGISKGLIDQIYGKKVKGYPSNLVQEIKAKCDFNFTYYNGLTAQQMAIHHESLIEDEPLGKHMGWALSYLRKGEQLTRQVLQDQACFKAMSPDYQQRIQNLYNYFQSNNPKAEQRNEQIYKHPVKTAEQLPQTQITFQNLVNLAGMKPPVLDQKPEGTEGFDGFMNEDQMQIINDCKSTSETRQLELNQALNQLNEMKQKAYLEHYVNNCLDAQSSSQQSQALPTSIKTKIDKIQQLGGFTQLKSLIDNVKGFSVNCGMNIQTNRSKLDQEQAFDQQMRQQHQQKWTRQESFKSNQEYYKKLQDLEEKFKQAQKVDLEIMGKFERLPQDIVLKSEPELVSMMPASSDHEFYVRNQTQINELVQMDQNFNNAMGSIRNHITNLTNNNINYAQEVASCVAKKVPKDKIQEAVLASLFDGIEEINKQIALASSTLGNICTLAMELNQKRQSGTSGSVQQTEQISSGLSSMIDCFDEVNGGLGFYNQLLNRLTDLEKKIEDYLMARSMESQNLQQLIGVQNNINQQSNQLQFGNVNQNMPSQVPYQQQPQFQAPPQQQQQPYFNAQTGAFNQGQSVFLGGQQQQNQFQNPYANNQFNHPPK